MLRKINNWHQTRPGLLIFGLIELVIAYCLATEAENNGSLLWYALTLIFLVGFLQNFIKFIASLAHHGKRR